MATTLAQKNVTKVSAPSATGFSGLALQRKCACGGSAGVMSECDDCQNKKLSLQRSALNSEPATRNSAPETQNSLGVPPIVHEVLNSPGQKLDDATRAFFEPRFGHDFSNVRVHADAQAAESARLMRARAYTVGQDIIFADGRYAPRAGLGRELLAHELTHVVQQRGQSGLQEKLEVSQPGDPAEKQADHVAEQVMRGQTLSTAMLKTSGFQLQRSPDVGFKVHNMNLKKGKLDDPTDDGAGKVTWPLSFDVTSPLEARPDVEVTGVAGDPCADHSVGFLQTVHIHWLNIYYWGKSAGDGSLIVKYVGPLPIRDGDPGTMWYTADGVETPGACNVHIHPHMDDYPTLFELSKVRMNTLTGQPNYLTAMTRGIHFVTTLADSSPAGLNPLRFFYWNYLMDIEFTPKHAAPNAVWPFDWKQNTSNLGNVHTGQDPAVPMFGNASPPFNQSLVPQVTEKK